MGSPRALIGSWVIEMKDMNLRFMIHKHGIVNLGEIEYLQERSRRYVGNKKVPYVSGYSGRGNGGKTSYDFGPCSLEDIIAYINGTRRPKPKHKSVAPTARFEMIKTNCDIESDEQTSFYIMECESGRLAINLLRVSHTKPSGRKEDDGDDDDDDDNDNDNPRRIRKTEIRYTIVFKSSTTLTIAKKEHETLIRRLLKNIAVDRKD